MDAEGSTIGDSAADIHQRFVELSAMPLYSLTDAQARNHVAEMFAMKQQAEAAFLQAVADLDSRPDAVPGARQGKVARTFLVHALRRNLGRASADVAAAHLGEQLPVTATAFAAGEISREHVDAITRALTKIPKRLLTEESAPRIDTFFAEHARANTPYDTHVLAERLLTALDPDGSDRYDPDAYSRREFSRVRDSTGMGVYRGQLDPASDAAVNLALEYFGRSYTPDGDTLEVKDERTAGQRRADALVQMAKKAMEAEGVGTRGGEKPRISIRVTLGELQAALAGPAPDDGIPDSFTGRASAGGVADCEQTGPISAGVLARFACDSVLERVLLAPDGAVLNLGRGVRTVTAGQRRALAARDGGCVIPGCVAGATRCDGHHVKWWRHGGRTDIANLCLLCDRHHTEIHSGIWDLEMRDGIPWVRPPSWLDRERRWVRNTFWDDQRRAKRLGEQLRRGEQLPLDADPPPDDDSQEGRAA